MITDWYGVITIQQATNYLFKMRADDGLRMWVNGSLLVDWWYPSTAQDILETKYLPEGNYDFHISWFQIRGTYELFFDISPNSTVRFNGSIDIQYSSYDPYVPAVDDLEAVKITPSYQYKLEADSLVKQKIYYWRGNIISPHSSGTKLYSFGVSRVYDFNWKINNQQINIVFNFTKNTIYPSLNTIQMQAGEEYEFEMYYMVSVPQLFWRSDNDTSFVEIPTTAFSRDVIDFYGNLPGTDLVLYHSYLTVNGSLSSNQLTVWNSTVIISGNLTIQTTLEIDQTDPFVIEIGGCISISEVKLKPILTSTIKLLKFECDPIPQIPSVILSEDDPCLNPNYEITTKSISLSIIESDECNSKSTDIIIAIVFSILGALLLTVFTTYFIRKKFFKDTD